jgi:hypothetical protein
MARPRVADGGDALQFWRVAANILNKQSRQPTRGGPPAWGLGVGQTIPHRKNKLVSKILKEPRSRKDSVETVVTMDTLVVGGVYRAVRSNYI